MLASSLADVEAWAGGVLVAVEASGEAEGRGPDGIDDCAGAGVTLPVSLVESEIAKHSSFVTRGFSSTLSSTCFRTDEVDWGELAGSAGGGTGVGSFLSVWRAVSVILASNLSGCSASKVSGRRKTFWGEKMSDATRLPALRSHSRFAEVHESIATGANDKHCKVRSYSNSSLQASFASRNAFFDLAKSNPLKFAFVPTRCRTICKGRSSRWTRPTRRRER